MLSRELTEHIAKLGQDNDVYIIALDKRCWTLEMLVELTAHMVEVQESAREDAANGL